MHFNKAALTALACHPSGDFNKEGILLCLERQDSFFRRNQVSVKRWCRLRGNLLFYFKSKDHCSEPVGCLILEDFQVLDEDLPDLQYSFTIVYPRSRHIFCASSLKDKISWISNLQRASISYLKSQIGSLLNLLEKNKCQSIPIAIQSHRMHTGASIDLSKPPLFELAISCDNLRCNSNGSQPSPKVSIYISNPPHKIWILYGQTEVLEGTSNPLFRTTVAFRSCDGICDDTRICFIVNDIREMFSNVSSLLGKTMVTIQDMLEAGRMRLFLLSPERHTVGFITLTTWMSNYKSRHLKSNVSHATPNHLPAPDTPKTTHHRRTQSLPSKLCTQLKQPSQASLNLMFENPILATFRFHSGLGGDISVLEIMAEPFLSFRFPQQLLKLWINEEKLCRDEMVSLGELNDDWKSRQKEILNQHLALVNLYEMSLSTLTAKAQSGIYFKKSVEKNETYLDFVPVNFHLQRLFAQNSSLRRSKFYDIFTVGAFSASSLGFKDGGLLKMLHKVNSLHNQRGSPVEDKTILLEDTVSNLIRLRKETTFLLRVLIRSLEHLEIQNLPKTLDQLQEKINLLLYVLDTSLTEEALEFLDCIRVPHSNHNDKFTKASRHMSPSSHNFIKGYSSPEHALDTVLAIPSSQHCVDEEKHFGTSRSTTNSQPVSYVSQGSFEDSCISNNRSSGYRKAASHVHIKGNIPSNGSCNTSTSEISKNSSVTPKTGEADAYSGHRLVNDCYRSTDEPEPWDLIHLNIKASFMCLSSKIKNLTEKLIDKESISQKPSSIAGVEKSQNVNFISKDSSCAKQADGNHTVNSEYETRNSVTNNTTQGLDNVKQNTDNVPSHIPDTSSSDNNVISYLRNNTNNKMVFNDVGCVPQNSKSNGSTPLTQNGNSSSGSPKLVHLQATEVLSEVRPSIQKLRRAIDGLIRTGRLTYNVFRLKQDPNQSYLSHCIKYRRDVCLSQALTSVVTALLTKIWCRKMDSDFVSILSKVGGPLVQFEGLLSCYKSEAGRISDMIVAIEDVGKVEFVMIPATAFLQNPEPDLWGCPATMLHKVPLPRVLGSRNALKVFLSVPEEVFRYFSPKKQSSAPSDPPSFKVTPVFFNVGMNEEASLAAKLCKDGAQYRYNNDNFERLLSYYKRFKEVFPMEDDNRRNTLTNHRGHKKDTLSSLMYELRLEVFKNKSKNTNILHLASKVCRAMDGFRFTSCKSAKDRTSMSVTLEEVRCLQDDFDLSQSDVSNALNCLRSQGTRLRNCEKSIGEPKYKFSSIQLAFFPPEYKPPRGTFSTGLT